MSTADRAQGDGVVVLGGTAGIGWETAAQFAERGDRVAIIGRDPVRGVAACSALRARHAGAEVHFIQADAADADDAQRAATDAAALLGAINILICASGGETALRDGPRQHRGCYRSGRLSGEQEPTLCPRHSGRDIPRQRRHLRDR